MSTRTESFNEQNVASDFKEVMEQAEEVKKALITGNQEIDSVIGNASMEDAYSGQAAASIKNQWNELADTFQTFLQNFQNWYDQSVESAKEMANLQAATSTVQNADQPTVVPASPGVILTTPANPNGK